RYERPPLELVRGLARSVRVLKVQLLSLTEQGLGAEFFASHTSLQRLKSLLDDKLKELLAEAGTGELTAMQVVEQRQMLQQPQKETLNGLPPVVAALLAALDLARQRVRDPDGNPQDALRGVVAVLRGLDPPLVAREDPLFRLQRVHPGPDRAAFVH